jgi:hypothetical protein
MDRLKGKVAGVTGAGSRMVSTSYISISVALPTGCPREWLWDGLRQFFQVCVP